jgi:carbon-monoxide dehydrogenase small subunit
VTASKIDIRFVLNGKTLKGSVEPRMLLTDFIRHELRFTGTHVACGHGVCGACTISFNGRTARGCLLLAVQANGAEIMTVEGLAGDGPLTIIQKAFQAQHALQCGFCTPGFLMTITDLLKRNPDPSDDEIKEAIGGNLCRCTGYINIMRAVRSAANELKGVYQLARPHP